MLETAPRLLAVGAFCIGTNQIDLQPASQRGVAVFNAPFSNTRSVVELALAEIIALTRRLTEKNAGMHAGVWDKSAEGSHEVRGRRLGIVGYGNIGTQLSVLAETLGMSVSFYDTADKLALGNARRCATLDELLEVADVVTLHVDGRPGNSGFFGEEQFARMRPGSLFLNLSRGFVVDHAALRAHILEPGHLAGAAVDVFPDEPKRQRRRVRLRAARAAQRHPHPAHRRVHRGGPGRTSAASSRASCQDFVSDGSDHAVGEPPRRRPAAAARHAPAGAPAPATPPACSHASTASSPTTGSTSRGSCSAPAATSATCSPTSASTTPEDVRRGARGAAGDRGPADHRLTAGAGSRQRQLPTPESRTLPLMVV